VRKIFTPLNSKEPVLQKREFGSAKLHKTAKNGLKLGELGIAGPAELHGACDKKRIG